MYEIYICASSVQVGGGEVPAVADRWQWDLEYGRQFLQGTHPTAFRRLEKLPDNFPVRDEDVKAILGRKVCLDEEIEVYRIKVMMVIIKMTERVLLMIEI